MDVVAGATMTSFGIENLLAAGELIFGNLFAVRYPASGTGIGMSTYTGALAAKTTTDMAE